MTAQPSEPLGNPQLGELIREQIARQRFTIGGVAATIRVHRSTLSRWIAGDVSPSPAHLARLEAALGVRFVDDGAGHYEALDAAPDRPPAPQVVVLVVESAEAMREALDRLGLPRGE